METLAENNILKTIQDIFNYYLPKGKETLNKTVVLRIFFDYDIMDNCGYDIFQISNFLNQLNPTNDEIDIKKFLLLLFYIYRMQINKEFEDSDVTEISVDNVNELSDNRKQIVSSIEEEKEKKKKRISRYENETNQEEKVKLEKEMAKERQEGNIEINEMQK